MIRLARMGHPVYYFACVGFQEQRNQPTPLTPDPSLPLFVYNLSFSPQVKRFFGLRRWMACLRVAAVLARRRIRNPILWFYHPALFPLGYSHNDSAIVYDVMDHFPSFEESIDDFHFDELALLAESDYIFTGGRSLFRHISEMLEELYHGTKVRKNVNASSLPSGVDFSHFKSDAPRSPVIEKFASPRFGYIGAIDERIDWDILIHLAVSTTGSVLLMGPLIGSIPEAFPPNLHILGPGDYSTLPSIVAAFDVGLIPFKMSALVQFVSPTKTPEYLAAGKPVVCTPIPDVISDYGNLVTVADTAANFTTACLKMAATPPAPETLTAGARSIARSWDDIAAEMQEVVTQTTNSNK